MIFDKEQRFEVAPNIFFIGGNGTFRVSVFEKEKELIGWDYDEIKLDPRVWFQSLKSVAIAIQCGPTATKTWIKQKRQQIDSPAGSIMCNNCQTQFMAGSEHPFIFEATLNGNHYKEYQCSALCLKHRTTQVYCHEMGKEFINMLENKFSGKLPESTLDF